MSEFGISEMMPRWRWRSGQERGDGAVWGVEGEKREWGSRLRGDVCVALYANVGQIPKIQITSGESVGRSKVRCCIPPTDLVLGEIWGLAFGCRKAESSDRGRNSRGNRAEP